MSKVRMFYLGLCIIEQIEDDDNPDVIRNLLQTDAIEGPNLTVVKTSDQLSNYLRLINAAKKLRTI